MGIAEELKPSVVDIVRRAGTILSEGYGGRIAARDKEGIHNLVTEYDLRVEQFLIAELSRLYSGSAFLAEESGSHTGDSECTWIVDPLDGTVNFAHGIPIFCISVAAVISNTLSLGVIYHPLLKEMFVSVKGAGAYLNDNRLKVSEVSLVADSMLVTGFPYNVQENPRRCIDQFSTVLAKGLPIRRLGSAALDLAYTAAGRFDGFWEVQLAPWDMAAGALMVQEAGGTVTHYDNKPFVLGHESIVATNGSIHNELVTLLAL